MKTKLIATAFFNLLLAISLQGNAQDPTTKIVESLQKYTTERPQEKVYLHFDKPYYAAGDTIWFKAYTITAVNNLPTNLSNTLNVNMVNEKDSVLHAKKIHLESGMGVGMMVLPFGIKKGNYVVYANTPWMQNFGLESYFKKTIKIENPFTTIAPVVKKNTRNSELSFFPESGNMIVGIRSKIAFKYIDQTGFGKAISGDIVNKNNEKITSFETSHAGMGIFAITPVDGEIYSAVFNEDGKSRKVALPLAKKAGYVLAVNNLDTTNLLVKIAISPELVSEKDVVIVAQNNGVVKYGAKIKSAAAITTIIPKKDFPTGIAQLTLFDVNNLPVAERLVFINHNDDLKMSLSTDKSSYNKKDKVALTLDLTHEKQVGLGSYSIAVTDESKVKSSEDEENGIFSNLLLTSDLRGYIENPGYYFNKSNVDASKHLDYLLLTNGWRRFKWDQVLNNTAPPLNYKVEKGITISGIVTTMGGKPIPDAKIRLLSSKGTIFTTDTVAGKDGKFTFDEISFMDSVSFIIQAKNKDKSNIKLTLDQPLTPVYKAFSDTWDVAATDMTSYTENIKKQYAADYTAFKNNSAILLKAVEIKGQAKKDAFLARSSNMNGAGNADKVITGDELANAIDLFDYLDKWGGGMSKINGQMILSRNRNTNVPGGDGDAVVQFYLDGSPVSQEFIEAMPVEDIALVEVLKNAAFTTVYGSGGAGGIILVSTKTGSSYKHSISPGIIGFKAQGFDAYKDFYSPKYTPNNIAKEDLRSTIYWNPNVIIGKENKKTLDYFNADGIGTYKVVVEGINADGKVGRAIYKYTVK
ncbi:TonB-dependent receptor plug domain-containing protein [Pedobacter boryungensis]|uniref:TonB-dependent receptor plug domain-containing protein n=1 Tax=Pedobacter boryungensis TaxID=869962 RepID=A0ABX2DAW0_9SPHI|nr:TonB-dependent receptor plug domain-containing protein [Pedobacter boryungensis]NQX31184.1 TonB-dependent receptor plug domain-containing protein [Pedobacter boryungensis]